jgi:hypothetical protein
MHGAQLQAPCASVVACWARARPPVVTRPPAAAAAADGCPWGAPVNLIYLASLSMAHRACTYALHPLQLLLAPSVPPGSDGPVLLGYLLLFTWQRGAIGAGVGGGGAGGAGEQCSVPASPGLTFEDARRCLTANSRTNAGCGGGCG